MRTDTRARLSGSGDDGALCAVPDCGEACMLRRTTRQCALCAKEHHYMKRVEKKRQGPRIVVRRSGIHGRGVFARRLLHEDETVCEYKGEIISEAEVARRYPEDMHGLNHTFIFGIAHDHNI
ncbi:MAG: hypothetical protein AAB654_12710, partial [Acidobacteriota bacterium]